MPPQSFDTEPQFLPAQAVTFGVFVQPHTLSVPPPPHVSGEVHEPHACMPPQPFGTDSHFPRQAVAFAVGTHWQELGVPWQASLPAQAVQRAGSAQPLLASVGTHLLSHSLVPVLQVPRTHAPPSHTTVPEPTAGQLEASHPFAEHP